MDVASLGLAIDSTPLTRAVQELRQMPAAARGAAAGAEQVVGSAERMAAAMTQSTAAVNQNARALQVAGSASRLITQQMANSFAGVRDDFGSSSRAADVAAYGRALDDVRAKYNPLFAAGRSYRETLQEINDATRMGAISEKERSDALIRTKAAFAAQVTMINATNVALSGNGNALRAVAIQIPDMVQGLAMGQSAFQIFTQQGLQVAQVLGMQPGGIGGAFREIRGWMAGFITPASMVAGAILGIGAAALTAASQWESAQRKMQLSLFGAGAASGATVGGLNNAAAAGASTFGLSIAEARDFAAQLAVTGKIGVDEIGKIVKVGHDVATVFGIEATDAAKLLAQSFSDPVRGAEKLNERLGFLSARMQSDIASLVAQNRLYDAQRMLLSGVAASVDGASASISGMAKGWAAVGNAISNAWSAIGRWTAKAAGLDNGDIEARLSVLDRELQRWQQLWDRYRSGDAKDSIRAIKKEIEDLTAQQEKNRKSVEETQRAAQSKIIAEAVARNMPEAQQLKDLENQYVALSGALGKANSSGGEHARIFNDLPFTYNQLTTAVERARGAVEGFKSEYDKTIALLKLDISAVGVKGPNALANIVYQRSLLQSGSTGTEAKAKAELERTLAIKQAQQQILDTQNARLLSSQQATEAAQMELAVLGKSVAEQEEMRGKLAARQQLEQEALQTYGSRDAYDREHLAALEKEIEKQAEIKQLLAEQALRRDIAFDAQTALLPSGDQSIAARLRAIYGDNGWKSMMGSNIAETMRWNDALRAVSSTIEGSLTSGIADAIDGAKSFREAMHDTAKSVLRALEEMIIKLLVIGPLMRSVQSFMGLPIGFTASANGNVFSGGNVIPFARGGVVSRPTVFPMASGAGLMGEAGPEAVMPLRRGGDGRLGVEVKGGHRGGDNAITIAPVINVTMPAGAKPEDGSQFADQIGKTLVPMIHAEVGKFMLAQSRGGGQLARIG